MSFVLFSFVKKKMFILGFVVEKKKDAKKKWTQKKKNKRSIWDIVNILRRLVLFENRF